MLIFFCIRLIFIFCEIFAVFVVIFANNLCVFTVHGKSMEPGFCNGDQVIALSTSLKLPIIEHIIKLPDFLTKQFFPITRGDLVLMKSTNNEYIMKRVIGLSGDTIGYNYNYVHVNNKSLFLERTVNENLYIEGETQYKRYLVMNDEYTESKDILVVPMNHVYCLGDNRIVSVDSRLIGPYHISMIEYLPLFKITCVLHFPFANYCFWIYTWFIKFI